MGGKRRCLADGFYRTLQKSITFSFSGSFKAILPVQHEGRSIEGPDTLNRLWPKGRVLWFTVNGSNVFAGTDKGRVYLIKLPVENTR
ncbi:MAG: hypothetical protein L5655_01795 [Thermosediminibacteraceae bacterium]|nr:hypothetical protein [Thermosediminibacteraceae bacterium]